MARAPCETRQDNHRRIRVVLNYHERDASWNRNHRGMFRRCLFACAPLNWRHTCAGSDWLRGRLCGEPGGAGSKRKGNALRNVGVADGARGGDECRQCGGYVAAVAASALWR